MQQDAERFELVAQALFSQRPDSLLLARSLMSLTNGEGSWTWAGLIRGCHTSGEYAAVADVMVAAAASNPHGAHNLLSELALQFNRPSVPEVSFHFVLGAVLGCFNVGVWLGSRWPTRTEYEDQLPVQLPNVLFWPRDVIEAPMPWELTNNDRRLYRAYEETLAEAIRAWVRPNVQPVDGRRTSQYATLMQSLNQRLKQRLGFDGQLPTLVELVLNKLAYAQFGAISAVGRVAAMDACMQSLLASGARVEA